MAKVRNGFSILWCLLLLMICVDFNEAKFESNKVNVLNNKKPEQDKLKCLIELNKIKQGVQKYEQWALRLFDSWGKLPSAILDGNLYELGGFSECFHIERNQELYKTQYCLGQLNLPLNGKPNQFNFNGLNVQNILQTHDQNSLETLGFIPRPTRGPAITFGICLPDFRPLDMVEPIINELIKEKVKNVSVHFSESTCQYEENASELRTIDQIAIVIFAVFLCLVLASTIYDIMCTIKNSNKKQMLLAFSFYTNGMKLLSYERSKSSEVMSCVNGIRVITTAWVVLGHTFIFYMFMPIRNLTAIPTFAKSYHNMVLMSGLISVDTFFVLGGLFVTISMLKHFEKTQGRLNVFILYLHRYLRLTPVLAVSMLFSISLLRYLGNGPMWPLFLDMSKEQCERHWWSTLFYIQNYVNGDDICFAHSWYLSVDFQLFLMAPPVVYLIYRFKKKTIPIWILFMLGSSGCLIATRIKYDIRNMWTDPNAFMKLYFATHLRFTPWLIGVIAGYFFFKTRKTTIHLPSSFQFINVFLWFVSLGVMATVIFINQPLVQFDSTFEPLYYGLYDSLGRITWSIALIYIIFACHHGYGGPVNYFLSHPLWQPLSRLSYSIYLVHFPVVISNMATMKAPFYFNELGAFHAFLGNYIISVFVAIVATLAFESPIMIVEKMIFGSKNKSKQSNDKIEAVEEQMGEREHVQ